MGAQSYPQLQLKIRNLPNKEYTMNGADITIEKNAFLAGDELYKFSKDFLNFLTNPNITYEIVLEEDEERKVKMFLRDKKI